MDLNEIFVFVGGLEWDLISLCCETREERNVTYILVVETKHPRSYLSLVSPGKSAASGAGQTQFGYAAPDTASGRHSAQHVRLLVYSSTLVL